MFAPDAAAQTVAMGMDLSIAQWILGALAGLLVGFAKTGVPGIGILIVPLMAMVFPAKTSVGVLVLMLVIGDVFAVAYYRRHAQWSKLWGLFPSVIVGMAAATWTLMHVGDAQLKPILGWLVLGLLALELARQRLGWHQIPHHWLFVSSVGFLAGFATTVGNVAGPVMAIYLTSKGLEKKEFMGTGAWYFLIINASKIPIFWRLGMIPPGDLPFVLYMIPLITAGAVLGKYVLPRIPQRLFTGLVLLLAAVAALRLLW